MPYNYRPIDLTDLDVISTTRNPPPPSRAGARAPLVSIPKTASIFHQMRIQAQKYNAFCNDPDSAGFRETIDELLRLFLQVEYQEPSGQMEIVCRSIYNAILLDRVRSLVNPVLLSRQIQTTEHAPMGPEGASVDSLGRVDGISFHQALAQNASWKSKQFSSRSILEDSSGRPIVDSKSRKRSQRSERPRAQEWINQGREWYRDTSLVLRCDTCSRVATFLLLEDQPPGLVNLEVIEQGHGKHWLLVCNRLLSQPLRSVRGAMHASGLTAFFVDIWGSAYSEDDAVTYLGSTLPVKSLKYTIRYDLFVPDGVAAEDRRPDGTPWTQARDGGDV